MASDRHPDIHCIAPNDQAMMTPEQRAHLSQQCQISLSQLRDLSTSNADDCLPHFELSNSTHPGTVSRWFHAGVGIVGAVTRDVVSNTSNEIAQLAHAVGRGMTAGVEANIIVAENQLPKQIQAVAPEMSRIIHHPGPALANFGHELVQVGGEIGSGIKTLGGDVVDGTASTAEWVAHHKVESAVIAGTAIGAAALEVFSAGTATPVLWAAGATAIGTGVGVHTGFSVGAKLEGDSQQFSILAHPDHYPQSAVAAAQKQVAADLTGPIESLVMTAVGVGAAKVVKLFSDGAEVGGLATASSADVAPAAGEGALTRAAAHPAVAPDAVTMPKIDSPNQNGELALRPELPSAEKIEPTQFRTAPVTDDSWHKIYKEQFPVDERLPVKTLERLAEPGSLPQVKLQLTQAKGETQAFSILSDYGELGGENGQGLLLAYIAVDEDLQGQGIGGKHLEHVFAEAKANNPKVKGMAIEVEAPHAAGISKEDAAKRQQRIDFYAKHNSYLLDRPYLIPSAEEGADPIEARLIWRDFDRGGLNKEGLNALIAKIYKHGYELPDDHPLVQQACLNQ